MDSMSAFAMGLASRDKPKMIFDWDRAALRIKESGCKTASAGLRDDWGCTGGLIFDDGKPVSEDDTYVYLASTWAVPELEIGGEVEPCYFVDDGRGWDSGTYWPESALEILGS